MKGKLIVLEHFEEDLIKILKRYSPIQMSIFWIIYHLTSIVDPFWKLTRSYSVMLFWSLYPISKTKLDFTCIEGIGPKINQLLVKAGYQTFEDLSTAKANDLKTVLTDAGPRYKMHDPKNWAKQAKMAAKGEWTKLQEYKNNLK